jgi:thiol-disulfide isomerase/thioredoxin
MIFIMKKLFLCVCAVLCTQAAHSQSEPIVAVDNIAVIHEHKGWRVTGASTTPIHFNLMNGDLIVRIDGKNAADTGPMIMASLFNQGNRRKINVFIERGDLRIETALREIRAADYEPVGANPFRQVASGFSAPDTAFEDIEHQPLTLEHFKGHWLLINFMATWCAPCMEGLPKVLSVAEHNDLSLNLLTVALKDKAESVRRMQQSYQIGTPIAMMGPMSQLPIDFGITTNSFTGQIPALVLIRPDGDVALIDIGGIDADHVGKTIETFMSRKGDDDVK